MKLHYYHNLNTTARTLRQAGNLAEVLLWQQIKCKKLGYQFLRQRPIHKYVVDFFCSCLNLAIEIDGVSHDSKIKEDIFRQQFLESKGVSFLRFEDADVKKNLDSVVEGIKTKISEISGNSLIKVRKSPVTSECATPFMKGGS